MLIIVSYPKHSSWGTSNSPISSGWTCKRKFSTGITERFIKNLWSIHWINEILKNQKPNQLIFCKHLYFSQIFSKKAKITKSLFMKNSRNNNIILGFSIWFQLIQWIDHKRKKSYYYFLPEFVWENLVLAPSGCWAWYILKYRLWPLSVSTVPTQFLALIFFSLLLISSVVVCSKSSVYQDNPYESKIND